MFPQRRGEGLEFCCMYKTRVNICNSRKCKSFDSLVFFCLRIPSGIYIAVHQKFSDAQKYIIYSVFKLYLMWKLMFPCTIALKSRSYLLWENGNNNFLSKSKIPPKNGKNKTKYQHFLEMDFQFFFFSSWCKANGLPNVIKEILEFRAIVLLVLF